MDCIEKLNRLKRLYNLAISFSSPYRVGSIRKAYEETLAKVRLTYELRILGSHNYSIVFGTQQDLVRIVRKKNNAILNKEYELAAKFRDDERALVRKILSEIKIPRKDSFFLFNDYLYQIQ